MGTKTHPGEYDCYYNALPDEPIFILLARDTSAPNIIRVWARERMDEVLHNKRPVDDAKVYVEAMKIAGDMERWRKENLNKWRTDAGIEE
jgi:hypothetical protein